jgi:hypothetical protein
MKLQDLNGEMLIEMNLHHVSTHVSNKAKKITDNTKNTLLTIKKVLVDEFNDNIAAFKVLKNKFKEKDSVNVEDFKKALEQIFVDNTKLLTIAGISVLPGSALTLPLVMKFAKKIGINLVPSKTYESL